MGDGDVPTDAAASGVLVLDRDGDGRVTDVCCDVVAVATGRETDVSIREACWIDAGSGLTFVNHRHNGWCCQILDVSPLISSSNGNALSWELYASSDEAGAIVAGFGMLPTAVLLAVLVGLVVDLLPETSNRRLPGFWIRCRRRLGIANEHDSRSV